MPVRVMKLLGVEQLIATNAGGGLNKTFMVTNGRPENLLVNKWRSNNVNGNQCLGQTTFMLTECGAKNETAFICWKTVVNNLL